ncbi:MAG: trehalose-phosphatase [Actinomycetales bacterium]|nr:trehalose-phosphatase [Actinomycetales bacterium]
MAPVPAASELSPDLRASLATFATGSPILVALDFDGCLAPFVLDPSDARPLPESSAALRALAASDGVQLALVSGRPAADLATLADPPAGTWLIGSHGVEVGEVTPSGEVHLIPFEATPAQSALRERVVVALTEIAARHAGSRVEHKPVAAALHTRGMAADDAARALDEALTGPGSFDGVHAMRGNDVAELAVLSVTKGDALVRLRVRLAREASTAVVPPEASTAVVPPEASTAAWPEQRVAVLYAGDDVTDENALATLLPGDVGVKVGPASTVAQFRVSDEHAVGELLTELARLRSQRPGG